jgi:hypothetical protein
MRPRYGPLVMETVMPDVDQDAGDPQDEAEVYDETHGADEDPTGGFAEDTDGDPAELTDVFDVTSAVGDADDDEDNDTADDYDDEDLKNLDLDDEEDADEDDDDGLDDDLEDAPEYDAHAGLDRLIDRTAERGAPGEPGLSYVGDLDAITNPRDDDVDKYETTRPLSDEQLADLGYLERPQHEEVYAVMDEDKTLKTPEHAMLNEHRSFRDAEDAVLGSGAKAEDIEDMADQDESDRLDEGLEETFPASDPVSAKHIT